MVIGVYGRLIRSLYMWENSNIHPFYCQYTKMRIIYVIKELDIFLDNKEPPVVQGVL